MTYLSFHFSYLLPPIAILLVGFGWPPRPTDQLAASRATPLVCVFALIYTTPWDNYLVAQNIWWYGEDRVIATLGYVPIEEYIFILLQSFAVALFTCHYADRWGPPGQSSNASIARLGTSSFAGLALLGGFLLVSGQANVVYLGLILAWAMPMLAAMWLYDGGLLWTYRSTLLGATGIPTLYLWIADTIAIQKNIWTISTKYTIGLSPFGLPIEEAIFFLLTNLLVVQGTLLLMYGLHDYDERIDSTI